MTDDLDRCEWVNVSSSTGSPGLSRTKSRVKWLSVCVGVCVCDGILLTFFSSLLIIVVTNSIKLN